MKAHRWLVALACVTTAFDAHANGRFPGATQLVMRGQEAAVATSIGLVTTGDGFATTRWACEAALGYDVMQNNDLSLAIFGDGAIAIAGTRGLTVSPDLACTNDGASVPAGATWIADVSVDARTPSNGLAVVRGNADADAGSSADSYMIETRDNGRSWSALGPTFPSAFYPLTVDSAPSNPNRIYVSGTSVAPDGVTRVGQLLVSDDRGATWTIRTIPNEPWPFIAGIDPSDADTVYVRTITSAVAGDVLVSNDAGATFRLFGTMTGTPLQFYGVTGFALSPDGSKVAYGSVNEGLFIMEKNGARHKAASFPILCLTWTSDGLYACSAPNLCGPFFIGRSQDEGQTFTTVLPSLDVHGDQTACAPGTPVATTCPSQWATFESRIRSCPSDAGAPEAGAVDASTPSDAGDAGAPVRLEASWGCREVRSSGPPIGAVLAAALAGIVAWARRRR